MPKYRRPQHPSVATQVAFHGMSKAALVDCLIDALDCMLGEDVMSDTDRAVEALIQHCNPRLLSRGEPTFPESG